MPTLAVAKAANASTKLAFKPVALFVGGTSGIGQGAAEAFARYTDGNAHIILSGRNQESAKNIIASFPQTPSSEYDFLRCDAIKMANVKAACDSLKSDYKLSKLNYLFLSPGYFDFVQKFDDNGEGIDKKLALNFYARFKFASELLPLLQAAKDAGEEARVVSVYSAGRGEPVDLNDLGLRKTYGPVRAKNQATTYNSLAVEEFARRNPDISFSHVYPGGVNTPIGTRWWFVRLLKGAMSPLLVSPNDCAEWLMRPLFDPSMARGAFHLDPKAEPVPAAKLHLNDAARTALYQHFVTLTATK